jgi:hypothetical protein
MDTVAPDRLRKEAIRMSNKRGSLNGRFIGHTLDLRKSAAWQALPDKARRVLDRLELELMEHGGYNNGDLTCTYSDFIKAGLHRRNDISLAIRQCVELGFVEVKQGTRSIAHYRNRSLYRLTHVLSRKTGQKDNIEPTNEYRRIKTDEDAQAALLRAAASRNHGTQPHLRPKKAGPGNGPVAVAERQTP